MNALREVQSRGQSIWLDYIRRSLMTSGELGRLIQEDGVSGMTSNPTIFEKAIDAGTDYDEALARLLQKDPHGRAATFYEELAVEDIQLAADALRGVYERTGAADGFVSIEVSPHVAHDTGGSMVETRRLWRAVSRPNVMVKIPCTREGLPAIENMLAEGININITLMFSQADYEAVARAYLRALERCRAPERIASVASFFVSRVDTEVDKTLEAIGSREALALRGKAAIANSKLVYRRFREIFHGEPFRRLRERGCRVQRVLWASTSTKNPRYPDVMYVEELIGPDTVNTLPPATLEAFRDHGRVRGATVEDGLDEAEATLAGLRGLGIDLDEVAARLHAAGEAAFAASLEALLSSLEKKCGRLRLQDAGRGA